MLSSHSTGGFATTSAPEGFGLEDFEEAGLRTVERRFSPKDTIFTPGDPDDQFYFLLSILNEAALAEYASRLSGLTIDGQAAI